MYEGKDDERIVAVLLTVFIDMNQNKTKLDSLIIIFITVS